MGAATLLVAAWVSTAGFVPALRGIGESSNDPVNPPQVRGPGTQQQVDPTAGSKPVTIPPVLEVVIEILLIIFALLLMTILFRSAVTRRRRRLAEQSPIEAGLEVDDDDLDGILTQNLARSADAGLARLAEGDPRNAIVRCWLVLEDTVIQAGLPRDPSLTSQELTAQVLGRYAVDGAAISELGELYREARFSAHQLEETHRRRAVAALNQLRDGLDAAVHARAAAAPAVSEAGR